MEEFVRMLSASCECAMEPHLLRAGSRMKIHLLLMLHDVEAARSLSDSFTRWVPIGPGDMVKLWKASMDAARMPFCTRMSRTHVQIQACTCLSFRYCKSECNELY